MTLITACFLRHLSPQTIKETGKEREINRKRRQGTGLGLAGRWGKGSPNSAVSLGWRKRDGGGWTRGRSCPCAQPLQGKHEANTMKKNKRLTLHYSLSSKQGGFILKRVQIIWLKFFFVFRIHSCVVRSYLFDILTHTKTHVISWQHTSFT